jgi:hypothetical protein
LVDVLVQLKHLCSGTIDDVLWCALGYLRMSQTVACRDEETEKLKCLPAAIHLETES